MYERTPLWIEGTVVRFEHVNPHTVLWLEDGTEDGRQVLRWAVEGPSQSELDRIGVGMDVPRIGEVVQFCAFPYKPVAELSRVYPGVDFSARRAARGNGGASPQFVAGHVLVTPDGERRLWEPHGVIAACMRSSDDQRPSWIRFLNTNARARRAWCEQREFTAIQADASLREFIETINGLIDDPCA